MPRRATKPPPVGTEVIPRLFRMLPRLACRDARAARAVEEIASVGRARGRSILRAWSRDRESMPSHRGKFIAYFRVSTDKQGKSGLGLEAQRKAVLDYLNGGRWELVREFVEVESGKHNERPQLKAALAACKKHRARLLVAKLDRLSRNRVLIATLRESGVEFTAVDNPHANELTIHLLAAVAQHEREMISERTKAALQAAKVRGKQLGNPRLAEAAKRGTAAMKTNARQFAANVLPIIEEIERSGVTSHNAIAAKLNERNVRTPRGGKWTHVQVGAVLALSGQARSASSEVE